MTTSQMFTTARLDLDYPMSLGVYDQYARAQHVVDLLSDQGSPAANAHELLGAMAREATV